MIYTLPQAVEQSAEKHPDRDAFRFGKRALTYSALCIHMHQVANTLTELGVKRGDRVGVYLDRCLETSVAIYGIMKAGAIYVPLNPQAPAPRICDLIENCQIRYLLTIPAKYRSLSKVLEEKSGLEGILALSASPHLSTDAIPIPVINWQEVVGRPATVAREIRILEQDLAYIMFTSGSTGTPKGIMHTHYSGLSYARLSAKLYGVRPEDRIANHAPLHFDISTFGYLTSPFVGAKTVIIPEPHTKMPASLAQLIEQEQITIWYSVPLALIQLLQLGGLEQRDHSSLRWVLFGGEPFPNNHLVTLMQQWPQATFSNVYGPAEVNQCTYYNFTSPPELDRPLPIGQVWENTEALVVNEQDQPVSAGEEGELLVRSATRMKGYWNDPILTKQAFFERTPFPGWTEIFYRTGDLVKEDSKGRLLFLGRKDRQIKTRGYRVELDGIASILVAHPAISEAAVFTYRDESETLLIGAAILWQTEGGGDEEMLRSHLGQYLPWYAFPHKFIFPTTLPRTSNGKVNYLQLQEQLSTTAGS